MRGSTQRSTRPAVGEDRQECPSYRGAGSPRAAVLACLIGLLAAPVLGACGAVGQRVQPTPTPIPLARTVERPTYKVRRGDIVEELRLSGRVSAVREKAVGFTESGRILRINVEQGDRVKQGQLLAELDQRQQLNELGKVKAALDQANLARKREQDARTFAVRRAQLDLEEANTLLAQARTEGERQLADIGIRRARVGLEEARAITNEEAEAVARQAKLEYDRVAALVQAGRLVAPFDGQVSEVATVAGEQAEEFAPIVTVIDPSRREVRAAAGNSNELARLSPKQRVRIEFNRFEQKPVTGVIQRLPGDEAGGGGPGSADESVHISYPKTPGMDLEIGDLAQVIVTLQRRENVLFLPPAAIRTFQGRRFVVVQKGERQQRVDVEVGVSGPQGIEITKGVSPGQVVVGQ